MALRPADTTHFTFKGSNWVFTPKQSTFLTAYETMTNAELAKKFGAGESTIETFIRGLKEKGVLPSHDKPRLDVVGKYKEGLKKLKKWAKNPTFENWAKYFGSEVTGKARGIGSNIRGYFTGETIAEESRRILDSLNVKKEIPKNAQDVLKTFTTDFFKKNRPLLGGTAGAILRTPLEKGTNDYPEIIKIFNKYKDDINISKLDKQDEILRLMKKNPVIIKRFKQAGVPLTFKNLRTRIARTHNAVINNSLNPNRYPGIFEDLSVTDRQQFLNKAMRTFDNTVFRSFQGQLVDLLKGNELNLANDKLSKFTNLKQFLADKMKYVGGKNMSLIELDHPISLAALEKSKNLDKSLRVNPISGDINKWKLTLDKRLNLLQKKGDVKGLRALNEVNQILFGKGSPSFTVGDKGISKITNLPPDFRKANILAQLKENVGLSQTLKKNIKNIPEEIWKTSGLNQARLISSLERIKDWQPEVLTRYIDEWTTKNPKWTKILEKRIGCKRGCLVAAANDNPAAFSETLKKTPQAARSFLNFAAKGGKFGAIAAAGAATAGLVKTFMNDDPTTYLSDENQQKNMLIEMVTGPMVDKPDPTPEILDYQLPVLGATAAAGTAAVAPSTIKASSGVPYQFAKDIVPEGFIGPQQQGVGKLRTTGRILGKGLAASGTPLGLLALEPLHIAGQVEAGDSLGEIATNPWNYAGLAFADDLSKFATKGLGPNIAKAMRLGISPAALRIGSRFLGLPGLALSLGISGYETYDDWKKKRGWFSEE
jgi:hypothetical protein